MMHDCGHGCYVDVDVDVNEVSEKGRLSAEFEDSVVS